MPRSPRLPASAHGRWRGGWGATSAEISDRQWAPGWDRGERCPPDPKGARGHAGGFQQGARWQRLTAAQRNVIRALRRAGYVARHRWEVEELEARGYPRRYVDGAGKDGFDPSMQPAIDPWDLARRLDRCSRWWIHSLRWKPGEVSPVEVPKRCRKAHVCPVCGAFDAARRGAALRRAVSAGADGGGPLALVTLTQRAAAGEPLARALERWWRGYRLGLAPGGSVDRHRKRLISGWYLGLEVTRGEGASPTNQGPWWHVHGHMVVSVDPSYGEGAVREWLGGRWLEGSRRAAGEAFWLEGERKRRGLETLEAFGWDPVAAGTTAEELAAGSWWLPIDRDDPVRVYQAAKYATPIVTLHPVPLAEWVAVSHRRKWRGGVGVFRSLDRLAAGVDVESLELPDARGAHPAEGSQVGTPPPAPDLGARVSRDGFRESPDTHSDREWRHWRLRFDSWDAVPRELHRDAEDLGGTVYAGANDIPWIKLPGEVVDRRGRAVSARLFRWRLEVEAATDRNLSPDEKSVAAIIIRGLPEE